MIAMDNLQGFNPPLTDEQIAENLAWNAVAREMNNRLNPSLPGPPRWDRERLGISPIPTHNQAGQLLPLEERWDPMTGRYYGDPA